MADNSYTKTYVDGGPLLEADLDSGYKSLQPAQDNLAYATTGSSSGDILASTGSNAVPGWLSPDQFAATIGASGANQILSNVSSVVASIANLIIGAISSCQASVANLIIGAISSCQSTVATLIVDAITRTSGTTVSHLGVGLSVGSSSGTNTVVGFVTVSGTEITLTTSGRPVFVGLRPLLGSADSHITITDVIGGYAEFVLKRDSTAIFNSVVGVPSGSYTQLPPGAFYTVDFPAAGTYTYLFQTAANTASAGWINIQLIAYEIT